MYSCDKWFIKLWQDDNFILVIPMILSSSYNVMNKLYYIDYIFINFLFKI